MPRLNPILPLLAMSWSISAAMGQTLEPTSEQFNEELRPTALISGSLIAGFQRADAAGDRPTISALVPPQWSGQTACIRVWTANGRYEAQNEYQVPELDSAVEFPVHFPTRYADFLLDQSAEEVAILTTRGSCGDSNGEIALSRWNSGGGTAQLLMNSFRADLVFVYVGDNPEPVQCRSVEAEIRSAYDVACDLAEEDLSGAVSLEIFRYTNRQAAEPTTLDVVVPVRD